MAKLAELVAAVDSLSLGMSSQFLQAQLFRFGARLGRHQGDPVAAERLFKGSAGLFREMSIPLWLAIVLLEHAEWLVAEDRSAEATSFVSEAREIFKRLEAKPWLDRLDAVHAGTLAEISAQII